MTSRSNSFQLSIQELATSFANYSKAPETLQRSLKLLQKNSPIKKSAIFMESDIHWSANKIEELTLVSSGSAGGQDWKKILQIARENSRQAVFNRKISLEYQSAFPMTLNRRLFGWFLIQSKSKILKEDRQDLLTYTQLLASVLGHLFYKEEHKLLKTRFRLNELLQEDIESSSPTQLIARSCPIISSYFKAERTSLYAYDKARNVLLSIHAQDLNAPSITLAPGKGLTGRCFKEKATFFVNDCYNDPNFHRAVDSNSGFRTENSLLTPLMVGSEIFGVLQVLNKPEDFVQKDIESIKIIAQTLSSHLNTYRFMHGSSAAQIELESLLETIPEVIYRLDEEGKFQYVSQDVLKWGYFREELTGKHFSEIISESDLKRVSRDAVLPHYKGQSTGDKGAPGLFDERRSGKRGTKRVKVRIQPGPHIHYDDLYPNLSEETEKVFYTEVNASGFWINDYSSTPRFIGTIGIISDITERHFAERRLETAQRELIRAERFAGLGTLAAGIAHDFNNILAAIGLSADVSVALHQQERKGVELYENLVTIQEYVEKAADLTSRLLRLGRSNISKVEATNISDVIEDAASIVRQQIESKGIKFITQVIGHIPVCMLDRGQLRDILINLSTNSMHSIEEVAQNQGGSYQGMCISILARRKDHELVLTISDTGTGIEEDTLPRIFDPFFTTKNRDARKGTGLGLSMVFSVIKNHGGRVEVETVTKEQLGKKGKSQWLKIPGTTFKINLPIHEVDIESQASITLGSGEAIFKDAIIYIVDDEHSIVDLIQTVLKSHGYRNIKSFYNGAEAMQELEKQSRLPHLVITDVQMPPLDGVRLCEAIHNLPVSNKPRFVVISGKLSEEYIDEFSQFGVQHFLAKPCRSEELLSKVELALKLHPESPRPI